MGDCDSLERYDRAEHCRNFLRAWCKAGPGSLFRVAEGYRRPRVVREGGQEVVVVGRDWLASSAVLPEYLEGGGRG